MSHPSASLTLSILFVKIHFFQRVLSYAIVSSGLPLVISLSKCELFGKGNKTDKRMFHASLGESIAQLLEIT